MGIVRAITETCGSRSHVLAHLARPWSFQDGNLVTEMECSGRKLFNDMKKKIICHWSHVLPTVSQAIHWFTRIPSYSRCCNLKMTSLLRSSVHAQTQRSIYNRRRGYLGIVETLKKEFLKADSPIQRNLTCWNFNTLDACCKDGA
jgi:hypothetical protein